MRMSPHAWERWRQRHPDLDPEAEFAAARRPGKRLRLLLSGPPPLVPSKLRDDNRVFLVTSSGVVFVVAPDGVVVTVMRLGEAKRRARAKAKARQRRDSSQSKSG